MTLTIKLDRNWSSFQLANSAPPLSVTDSAIAPSARMQLPVGFCFTAPRGERQRATAEGKAAPRLLGGTSATETHERQGAEQLAQHPIRGA